MRHYSHLNDIYITERLKQRLSELHDHRITTIIAPMGYGKTTTIKWWNRYHAKRIPNAIVLHQIICTNSVTSFWNGFCHCLRNYPTLSDQMQALGYPDDTHTMSVLQEILCEELSKYNIPIYFILDDVYMLQHEQFPKLLTFLVNRLPENIHIILISRNQIFNESTRLSLGSSLCEITAVDLRLEEKEIESYANRCKLTLSKEEAKKLMAFTEGWISLIYLTFRGYVQKGYWQFGTLNILKLIEQVMLDPLPKRQQDFLIVNCVTEEFTSHQATFLWQEADGAALLDLLSLNNAFITYNEEGIYRYHHMLKQTARKRFETLSEEVRSTIYSRLGQWHSNKKEYLEAEFAYYKAGNWDGLMNAISSDCGKNIGGEHQHSVYEWSTLCPVPVLQAHPDAVLVLIRKLFSFKQIQEMFRLRKLLLTSLDTDSNLSTVEHNNYLGEIELVMSFLQYNDISAMSSFHRKACAMMSRSSCSIASNGTWTFGAPSVLMMFHRTNGELDKENANMRDCMPFYYQLVDGHGNGAEHSMQGETDFLRGRLTDAEINYHLAVNTAKRKGQYSILLTAEFLSMRMDLFSSNYEKMFHTMESFRAVLKQNRQFILLNTLDICEAWIFALLSHTEEVADWIMEPDAESTIMYPSTPMLRTIQNQVLLAKGEWVQIVARSKECINFFDANHTMMCTIYLYIQLAAAFVKIDRHNEAVQALKTALDLALPDGLLIPFVENGEYIDTVLMELKKDEVYKENIDKIFSLYSSFQNSKKIITEAHWKSGLEYGLTARELEITRLASERKTNQEIAETLCLSEYTVKNHLNRIFNKLDIPGPARNKRAFLSQIFYSKDR